MRVLDVPGLGYGAAVITMDNEDGGERLLLIDGELDTDDRIDVLRRMLDET